MVQLIVGKKGKGKTKQLLDKVNSEVQSVSGNIVYLDKSTKHMYELNNKIRLIDVSSYLITNAAIQYDRFNEIIHMKEYQTVYYDKSGNAKDLSVNSTNYYLQGNADAPSGITVLGGKTGTTNAAGHCLVLVSRDTSGNPYISVIMRAESREDLYDEMSSLLSGINK